MSCATHPELCGSKELVLRGPIAMPPASGWKILSLPENASHLAAAWARHPGRPDNSKSAWAEMFDFLKSNGVPVRLSEVKAISIPQWCDPEPFRCKGYKRTKEFLPWAKAMWEKANADMVAPADPVATLIRHVILLTKKINSRAGCNRCAERWAVWLKAHPLPMGSDLATCRRYLVDAHNHTREGQEPTPYETVAAKFFWTTP